MISNYVEYDAVVARTNALSDAPDGSPEARERVTLVADLRQWEENHEGEQSNGREAVDGLTRPGDWSVSGLPFNIGKLTKD